MAGITLDELQAKHPPEDRDEYDRAYAAATLAGELAELVYTVRVRAGLTQVELAQRMGTTQSSIARIESGGSLPTINMLARLARATRTPLHLAAPGVSTIELGGGAWHKTPLESAAEASDPASPAEDRARPAETEPPAPASGRGRGGWGGRRG
jgi:transcriptional regulator with XRE-family HTH domain